MTGVVEDVDEELKLVMTQGSTVIVKGTDNGDKCGILFIVPVKII